MAKKLEELIENETIEVTPIEFVRPLVSYRNCNGGKAEITIEGVNIIVPSGNVLNIPLDQYDNVKHSLVGAWFKVG